MRRRPGCRLCCPTSKESWLIRSWPHFQYREVPTRSLMTPTCRGYSATRGTGGPDAAVSDMSAAGTRGSTCTCTCTGPSRES